MRIIGKLAIILLLFVLLAVILSPTVLKFLTFEQTLEKADVIYILAGAARFEERCDAAAELFKKGLAPKIVIADDGARGGWSRPDKENLKFVERSRRRLIENGVNPGSIIILPKEVNGTASEAAEFSLFAKANEISNVLLVTSSFHTRRTFEQFQRIFRRENLDIRMGITFPKDVDGNPKTLESFLVTYQELIKYGWYSIFG